MKPKLIFTLFLIAICFSATAQDPIYTEFFLVPETTNPGFTGYQNTWRAGLLHRRQWPDGSRRIDTDYGFVNNMVTDFAALGMTIMNHHEEFTNYNYLEINGAYSYYIAINDDWGVTPGIEVGYGRKNFNFENLVLEDQIDINTGATSGTSIDPGILHYSDKIDFIDVSAGFVVNNESTWVAGAVKHLNRPDISFTESGNVPLDMLISVNAGSYINLGSSPSSFLPSDSRILVVGHYLHQSEYNRLDFGSALDVGFFTLGALAATNPERKSSQGHFLTSVNPFVNFVLGEFSFGYAYDISTSKLGRTHGVHEFSLVWASSHTCASCDNYKVKLRKNGVNGYQRN